MFHPQISQGDRLEQPLAVPGLWSGPGAAEMPGSPSVCTNPAPRAAASHLHQRFHCLTGSQYLIPGTCFLRPNRWTRTCPPQATPLVSVPFGARSSDWLHGRVAGRAQKALTLPRAAPLKGRCPWPSCG